VINPKEIIEEKEEIIKEETVEQSYFLERKN
jgi:hypothetical protein